MLTVKILMQAVVIIGAILEQKRCRPRLTCLMAALDEVRVVPRVLNIDAHRAVPAIADRNKVRIDGGPQILDEAGQGIAEVFVFTAPETMASHDNPAAEKLVLRIEAGELLTFAWR